MLSSACAFLLLYLCFGAAHEFAHVLAACVLGCCPTLSRQNLCAALFARRVQIPCAQKAWQACAVRHSGWIFSALCACWAMWKASDGKLQLAAGVTAVEAVSSDLLGLSHPCMLQSPSMGWFFCGNFGLILINEAWKKGSKAKDILEKMVQVTMMRGAQTGGVVTYVKANRKAGNVRGVRSRVVNSKRTDLSKLVRAKLDRYEFQAKWWTGLMDGVRFYAGHTRFATTSKATLDGCHPHQWSPPQALDIYTGFNTGRLKISRGKNVEVFITHNGDLDFFSVCGRTYGLGGIQQWLERSTGSPMPCAVDSCAVAGLMDLLRTQGSWFLSIRYSFHFHVPRDGLTYAIPSKKDMMKTSALFDQAFAPFFAKHPEIQHLEGCRGELAGVVLEELKNGTHHLGLHEAQLRGFVEGAVNAFFDNDLLWAARLFLTNAKGSFGLCMTSSLVAERQLVVGARGQTMSVAFYPRTGLILYGSEQAAVKAAVGAAPPYNAYRASKVADMDSVNMEDPGPAIRYDLDDLAGELCLLDWGPGAASTSKHNKGLPVHRLMDGKVTLTNTVEGIGLNVKFEKRLVHLEDNPLVVPLPADVTEPIAADINDIPRALAQIQDDWNSCNSLNRLTAWNLSCVLKSRLRKKKEGLLPADAVDIVVSGCEVSLWLGEQFAADLSMAFKKLNIKTISSNKVLGLLGQEFAMPQFGHQFSEGSWDLTDTIVLLVSHSGGTFASLNVAKLLQTTTQHLFVVTSEWDTQIGKQLRSMESGLFQSRIFSTDIGVHPAEPCTISVAATHQLLTQIYEYMASSILSSPDYRQVTGSIMTDQDLAELERCNIDGLVALEDIVGVDRNGRHLPGASSSQELRAKGAHWAKHVLENPIAWILCFLYITGTVISGYPLVSGVSKAAGLPEDTNYEYITRAFDALIYVFLPQLCVLVILLVQRRPLLHRMTARTVVIGDSPWVAQSAEAFLSKIFACSYSAAGVNVCSGNPADHLVHRMTHRVVRGTLLACGRPDGRLQSLTTLENAVCLSVNQASSIQSIGVTCESLTIGHNPYKLPLSAHAVFLKGNRPEYLCEKLLQEEDEKRGLQQRRKSSHDLLGEYSNMHFSKDEPRSFRDHLYQVMSAEKEKAARKAQIQQVFEEVDIDGSGGIDFNRLKEAYIKLGGSLPEADIHRLFETLDEDGSGTLDIEEFEKIADMAVSEVFKKTGVTNRRGIPQVCPSDEAYFGQSLRTWAPPGSDMSELIPTQDLSMQLYECRIASLQRAVAFFVLFHEMGRRVANFWPSVSLGLLGYRMDRTHSIMRIATTASPVSGAEVRERMQALAVQKECKKLDNLLSRASSTWKLRKKLEHMMVQRGFTMAFPKVDNFFSKEAWKKEDLASFVPPSSPELLLPGKNPPAMMLEATDETPRER
eukprot:TRINITY_DN15999_c0_g2_i2.p1 TRINITY_DN15999_c0_g2~~TRINITY_DN15999_c0_g2_i2.p1  ORF type:complete len:1401 (-),score=231.76 TRINITY_DN15999_c0_g2_i2:11-4213(-)